MSVYEGYASREEAMNAIAAELAVEKDADGKETFRLPNREADSLREKLKAETANAQAQVKKRQELQTKYDELSKERERELIELNELRRSNPTDLRETLQKYVDETSASRTKIAELEAELEPLKKENLAFRERQEREKIEEALVAAARKRDCCETALRDVKRLAALFRVNPDAGIPQTSEGKLVAEVVDEEIAASPHWLKRSQGGGSAPGVGVGNENRAQRQREAMKAGNFADVLRHSPRSNATRQR